MQQICHLVSVYLVKNDMQADQVSKSAEIFDG